MSRVSTISKFFSRLSIYPFFSSAYGGALISSSCKAERALAVLLWAGIGLIVLMTCMHMDTLFPDEDLHTLQQLPPRIAITIAAAQAAPEMALKRKDNDSLFQLVEKDMPVHPLLPESVERDRRPQAPVRHIRQWQLHIQRPAIPETLVADGVANAARQLQSGQLSLARQALQAVLTQDPHSVQAMEGMRLASRQLGDVESEQKYLEMLRLEIPGYDIDHNETLISGLD